jgi:hypothetical protein
MTKTQYLIIVWKIVPEFFIWQTILSQLQGQLYVTTMTELWSSDLKFNTCHQKVIDNLTAIPYCLLIGQTNILWF